MSFSRSPAPTPCQPCSTFVWGPMSVWLGGILLSTSVATPDERAFWKKKKRISPQGAHPTAHTGMRNPGLSRSSRCSRWTRCSSKGSWINSRRVEAVGIDLFLVVLEPLTLQDTEAGLGHGVNARGCHRKEPPCVRSRWSQDQHPGAYVISTILEEGPKPWAQDHFKFKP